VNCKDEKRRTQQTTASSGIPANPGDTSNDGLFGPGCLGHRIEAAAHAAIGFLPRALRERSAHLWTAANLKRLAEAMSLWIRGAKLGEEQFAHLFFGRNTDDPSVGLLHGAAQDVSFATGHNELSDGSEKIAAALQVIGLERWSGFLAELQDRALDPATAAAIDDCNDHGMDSTRRACPTDVAGGIAELADEAVADISAVDGATPGDGGWNDPAAIGRPENISMPGQSGGGVHPRTWGLPPTNIVPPVRNPSRLNPGDASRPSETGNGGKSLWDEHGGEWRYSAGTWNSSSWDYNEHAGPGSPWRNIPANVSAASKI